MAQCLYFSLVEDNMGSLLDQIEPNDTLLRSFCQIGDTKAALQGTEKIRDHI